MLAAGEAGAGGLRTEDGRAQAEGSKVAAGWAAVGCEDGGARACLRAVPGRK